LKCSIDSCQVVSNLDEFADLDEDAKVQAIKKRDELDKKVALRNFEVVGKAKERVTKIGMSLHVSMSWPQ